MSYWDNASPAMTEAFFDGQITAWQLLEMKRVGWKPAGETTDLVNALTPESDSPEDMAAAALKQWGRDGFKHHVGFCMTAPVNRSVPHEMEVPAVYENQVVDVWINEVPVQDADVRTRAGSIYLAETVKQGDEILLQLYLPPRRTS